MPSNTERENRWVNAWSDLYELAGDANAVSCRLPDGRLLSLEEGKQWLQEMAYQGLLIHVSSGWHLGAKCAVLDALTDRHDLYGFEFDWFALDQDLRPALFSSAGYGPIPDAVLRHSQAHEARTQTLKVTKRGTPAVWKSYARAGLYAYVWEDSDNGYVRSACPSGEPHPVLYQGIQAIAQLPRMALSFAQTNHIITDEIKG